MKAKQTNIALSLTLKTICLFFSFPPKISSFSFINLVHTTYALFGRKCSRFLLFLLGIPNPRYCQHLFKVLTLMKQHIYSLLFSHSCLNLISLPQEMVHKESSLLPMGITSTVFLICPVPFKDKQFSIYALNTALLPWKWYQSTSTYRCRNSSFSLRV